MKSKRVAKQFSKHLRVQVVFPIRRPNISELCVKLREFASSYYFSYLLTNNLYLTQGWNMSVTVSHAPGVSGTLRRPEAEGW